MSVDDELNPYARRFAAVLFARHPDWRALATTEPWPNADPGTLFVALPSPADAERTLWVTTDGGEVTVGFGSEWHGHYGPWVFDDEAESFAQAIQVIDDIMADRAIVAVGYRNGKPAVASLLAPGEAPSFEQVARIELWSWSGAADRVIPA